MIIDSYVRIGSSFDGSGKMIEDYIQQMHKHNITSAILCPNKPEDYNVLVGNDYVKAVLEKYPEQFFGAVRVDPWTWNKNKEIYGSYFSNPLFRFIFMSPWEETFRCNDTIAYPIYDYATEKNLPVIIETGQPYVAHISQISEIAELYPSVSFFVTNAGHIDLSGISLTDVSSIMAKYQNVYLGTATAIGAEWLANLVQNLSKGRVVFQSGYPKYDVNLEVFRIQNAYFESCYKEAVFCNNIKPFII